MNKSDLKVVLDAFEECKHPYHMLTALEKVSEKETDMLKKLENIPSEVKKEWEDVDTVVYNCATYDDKSFKDYLTFAITVTVYSYFKKAISDLSYGEMMELLDMRVIPDLAKTLKELWVREMELESNKPDRRNKTRITNQLFTITNALLEKAKTCFMRWKYTVEKIANNLPLDEILNTLHSFGIRGMDEVIKALLPDAVTSLLFHINFEGVFFRELKLLADGMEKRMYSDEVLTKILNAMGNRSLYKAGSPVEEQLLSIYTEMIFIYWDVKDKEKLIN